MWNYYYSIDTNISTCMTDLYDLLLSKSGPTDCYLPLTPTTNQFNFWIISDGSFVIIQYRNQLDSGAGEITNLTNVLNGLALSSSVVFTYVKETSN